MGITTTVSATVKRIDTHTAQKMKFSIKDFFSKCDQTCRNLCIWSNLLKKSLTENFIFCAVPKVWFEHCVFKLHYKYMKRLNCHWRLQYVYAWFQLLVSYYLTVCNLGDMKYQVKILENFMIVVSNAARNIPNYNYRDIPMIVLLLNFHCTKNEVFH